MPQQSHPDLILFNIEPGVKEVMLVVGRYNGQVANGFKQPCVALLREWSAEHLDTYPILSQIERFELVISRTPPTSSATNGATREMERAAETSANFENNMSALKSVAADPWLRGRCVISNRGVFETARERYHSRENWSLRQSYSNKFQPCPLVEHVRIIENFCRPLEKEPSSITLPTRAPVAKSPFEWERMTEDEKARILFVHSEEWLNHSTPTATSSSSGAPIVIPAALLNDGDDWKGPAPSREELAEMQSDLWKRY